MLAKHWIALTKAIKQAGKSNIASLFDQWTHNDQGK